MLSSPGKINVKKTWLLPRTVELVCVWEGNPDVITIQTSNMTPLPATISRVSVLAVGWGNGYKCISVGACVRKSVRLIPMEMSTDVK